jgi:hypothetical protein
MVDSCLDSRTLNVVVPHRPDASVSANEAHSIASHFGERAFSWRVGPEAPDGIHSAFLKAGFAPQESDAAMSKIVVNELPAPLSQSKIFA